MQDLSESENNLYWNIKDNAVVSMQKSERKFSAKMKIAIAREHDQDKKLNQNNNEQPLFLLPRAFDLRMATASRCG